ncbi:hypothetical protein BDV98DRAFT_557346 [Pterulicium gracile]|uniref:3-oxo-5-alpha-steroid 4-dehydrogenase C-terminal domain-containing protein n=1 Tax=Pterulicium gracile TaxID=1884261 RepID=A0A5C3R0N8_9AGAR|nr:hypothetical protein BDV98DRAFT_557346 [Pterula gracilis]
MPLGTKLLVAAYYVHYLNRALISPLRTPSRSKSHLAVVLAAVSFNIFNGSMLGSYLVSPYAKVFAATVSPLRFYAGLSLWALGFVGNIAHDEILLNIRRKAKSKGKAKAPEEQDPSGKDKKEHYDIPHGLLYTFISYPNYFCEWAEWLGFALAAAPIPPLNHLAQLLNPLHAANLEPYLFAPLLTPPWIFLITEITTMLPRAWKGHKWYHQTFPHYPKERKVVVPFVL